MPPKKEQKATQKRAKVVQKVTQKKEGEEMKIKLAYEAEETPLVETVTQELERLFPRIKIRKSDRHEPYLHIYFTIGTGKKK